LQTVAVGVPRRELVEVDRSAPEPAVRHVAANLQPVLRRALVGAAEEAQVVDVEARRLEAGAEVEVDLLSADLVDADTSPVAVERRPRGIEVLRRQVGTLEVMAAVLLEVLNGARIGAGSIIAAGTLIPEKTVVEPESLWMGSPGKFRRKLGPEDQETILRYARNYLGYREEYLRELSAVSHQLSEKSNHPTRE